MSDKKNVDTQLEYQIDIGWAQNFNNLKNSIFAGQTAVGVEVPNKARNIAVLDNSNVKKIFIDIDGVRYTRDAVSIDY